MLREHVEKLRQEYIGQQVTIDAERPELSRLAGLSARVKNITMSGRALVQFEGADKGWYDIELDYVRVIDKPRPKTAEQDSAEKPVAAAEQPATEKLSRLELARLEKQAEEAPKQP